VRVHVCGVRGSTAAPGAEFARYGGHTSCVALAHDGTTEPTMVLDAGTGIRRVSTLLDGAPFRGSILLSHLHWDHTQGLPFFAAADRPDSKVDLYLPAQSAGSAEALLAGAMSPPHFPITPAELDGSWRFVALDEGTFEIGGFTVTALEVPHKGGRTFGYRISDGAATIAYLPDHGPRALGLGTDGLGELHDAALELAAGVDLLVHDAQHTVEELLRWWHFGHSAADYAVGLGAAAGARRVLLFHHGPGRDDDSVDRLLARVQTDGLVVDAAAEGMVIDLPPLP
jgi:phosphoribosyl 1,2-cyclic phosphodiesterase